ncbi:LuxR family transcriptional regulator [Mesorhizobium sp. NZP2234]|nr:LuxR family transcriptional regulator [Mesorhizobium sp. NZP2234]
MERPPIEEIPNLSTRERECILWTARGKSSWEMGKILNISENTVNFHMKNVMRKLGAGSRTVAAIKAVSFGILELEEVVTATELSSGDD